MIATCTYCGKRFNVGDDEIGLNVRCEKCGEVFRAEANAVPDRKRPERDDRAREDKTALAEKPGSAVNPPQVTPARLSPSQWAQREGTHSEPAVSAESEEAYWKGVWQSVAAYVCWVSSFVTFWFKFDDYVGGVLLVASFGFAIRGAVRLARASREFGAGSSLAGLGVILSIGMMTVGAQYVLPKRVNAKPPPRGADDFQADRRDRLPRRDRRRPVPPGFPVPPEQLPGGEWDHFGEPPGNAPGGNQAQARLPAPPIGGSTEIAGAAGGFGFRQVSQDNLVVGVRYSLGELNGEAGLDDFEPVFTREHSNSRLQSVVARDGYAMGGLEVDGTGRVTAVRVIFMPFKPDGKLDPKASYQSDWIGTPTGKPTKTLSGEGKLVLGFQGRRERLLEAVGLLLE